MWQKFLQGEQEQGKEQEQEQEQGQGQEQEQEQWQGQKGEREDTSHEQQKTADRCWAALRFSRPQDPSHTLAIQIQENGQER